MKYQTPQFIEVEDKIFGPFTFKQFIYLVGGAGLCFLAYRFLPFTLGVMVILPTATISLSLAFYRPNNRPFIDMLEAGFNFFISHKLYIWKKEPKKVTAREQVLEATKTSVYVPKLSESKLKDLTWSLDINETIYSKEKGSLETRKDAIPKNPF